MTYKYIILFDWDLNQGKFKHNRGFLVLNTDEKSYIKRLYLEFDSNDILSKEEVKSFILKDINHKMPKIENLKIARFDNKVLQYYAET